MHDTQYKQLIQILLLKGTHYINHKHNTTQRKKKKIDKQNQSISLPTSYTICPQKEEKIH